MKESDPFSGVQILDSIPGHTSSQRGVEEAREVYLRALDRQIRALEGGPSGSRPWYRITPQGVILAPRYGQRPMPVRPGGRRGEVALVGSKEEAARILKKVRELVVKGAYDKHLQEVMTVKRKK